MYVWPDPNVPQTDRAANDHHPLLYTPTSPRHTPRGSTPGILSKLRGKLYYKGWDKKGNNHTGSKYLCRTRWHQENKSKFKEFRPIQWHPLSILSGAFALDVIPLNKFFVTAASHLVNTQSDLQMRFQLKFSPTPIF